MSRHDSERYYDYMREKANDAPSYRELSRHTTTSRTPKVCDLCKQPITVGGKYVKVVYIEDGIFGWSKQHVQTPDFECRGD